MIKYICDKCKKDFIPNPRQEPYFEGALFEERIQMISKSSPLLQQASSEIRENIIKSGVPAFVKEIIESRIILCPTCATEFAGILKKFLIEKETIEKEIKEEGKTEGSDSVEEQK